MNLRDALATALRTESHSLVDEMCCTLGIEREAVTAFADGDTTLTYRELQLVLTHLGFKLERVSHGG
jgi:hypothetical protein